MRSSSLVAAALLLLVAPGAGLAQEAETAEPTNTGAEVATGVEDQLFKLVETVRESSQDSHRYNLETLSCGEFDQLATSNAEADQAVVSMLMVWAHGYKSGLEGIDFDARPASLEGMVELVTRAVEECEQHPQMLFHVAIGRIG